MTGTAVIVGHIISLVFGCGLMRNRHKQPISCCPCPSVRANYETSRPSPVGTKPADGRRPRQTRPDPSDRGASNRWGLPPSFRLGRNVKVGRLQKVTIDSHMVHIPNTPCMEYWPTSGCGWSEYEYRLCHMGSKNWVPFKGPTVVVRTVKVPWSYSLRHRRNLEDMVQVKLRKRRLEA